MVNLLFSNVRNYGFIERDSYEITTEFRKNSGQPYRLVEN